MSRTHPEGIRLQKVLASAGVASRRAAEDLIRGGRVTINGRPAALGQRIDPAKDRVEVDGSRIQTDEGKRYVMLNKPAGVITTTKDPEGRPSVSSMIRVKERLYPVGRLDADTEGLLLMTNDGELAYRLTHPSFEVQKIYLVEVSGKVTKKIVEQLEAGVDVGGRRKAKAVSARIKEVIPGRHPKSVLEITLHEGRKHVVRTMMEQVGHPPLRLFRLGIGPLKLRRLRAGEYRDLNSDELNALFKAVGL